MSRTKVITEVSVFVAMAVVIEVVFMGLNAFVPIRIWVYGGMISLSLLPIFIIAYRNGMQTGIYAGAIFGLLNFLLEPYFFTWVQFLLDYAVAFGIVGLGYIGVKLLGHNIKGFSLMVVIGVFLRFVAHFISGVVFFEQYMPEAFDNVYVYSALYNASYLIPSAILIIIVGIVLLGRIEEFDVSIERRN